MSKINFGKVYAFTNENLSSFNGLYNFNGAKVLSVIGSGDQYFSCLLYGAREIVLYDSNPKSLDFFVLKFYAMRTLSYEDFFRLSVSDKFSNEEILRKLFKYIPQDVARYLYEFKNKNGGFDKCILYSPLSNHSINYESDRIIPYFAREKYYKLQALLQKTSLPRMYIANLTDLSSILNRESFDIMLTSNIFTWLPMSSQEYLEFLKKFKVDIVQAHYVWNRSSKDIQDFSDLGFVVDEVPTVTTIEEKNFVITKK